MCPSEITQPTAGTIKIRRLFHPVEHQVDREEIIAYTRRTVHSLVQQYGYGQCVWCSIDGQPVPMDLWKRVRPRPGTTLTIEPVVGFWQALGALVWKAFVYAAVAYGFSYLGGVMFGQDPPERKTYNDRQTRGWSLSTTAMEGIPYQREYGGPFAAHGNAIAKWTDVNIDGDEVLHMILCFGDKGPSVGTQAGEIYVQDQPIGNFDGVSVTERYGTMDQTAIADQNKLEIRPGTPVTATDGAVTIKTPNNFVDDLEYTIEFDRGIWKYNGMGERESLSIGIKVEISEASAGSWTTLLNTSISGNQMTPVYKAYTVSDQGYACSHGTQYDLRFTKTTADADPSRNGDSVRIRAVREVIDVAFTRPGKPLIYIEALATDQLNSDMDVKVIRKGRLVRTYNGADWTIEWSNNRADIWLDMVTQPVITGNGGGVPYSVARYEGLDPANVNLSAWYEWRQWCAEQVTDGDGGTEDRMVYNGVLNTESDLWTVAYETAEIGRARTYWRGTVLDLWLDKVYEGAVDLITYENVLANTWRNAWSNTSEMPGKVTVFFDNAAAGYKRQPLPIPNEDAGSYKREVQIEGLGVTTVSLATRLANYSLYRNKLIRNVITVDMHKDAVRFDLGRVVRLQHDRPNWGSAYRIMDVTGAKTVEVNRDLVASPGDPVYLRAYDAGESDAVTATYTVATATLRTLVLVEDMDPVPTDNCILAIGSNVPLRRIVKIEQSERPQYYTVTLETYDEDLYDSDDLEPTIENPDYVWPAADHSLVRPVTEWQVRDMIEQALPPQPSMDIPRTSNIEWTGNSVDTVSWASEDGVNALLFNFKGSTYEITADSTTDEFIYWDPDFTDIFRTTNDANTALDTGNWLVCINKDGVAYPCQPIQLLHAAVILAGTIRADAYLELIENYVVNGWAACDASYPFERGFDIVDEMTAIVSVKLSVRIKPFRAYATAAASGGTATSDAYGGGSGDTGSSGTGATSTDGSTTTGSATGDTGSGGSGTTGASSGDTASGGSGTTGASSGSTSSESPGTSSESSHTHSISVSSTPYYGSTGSGSGHSHSVNSHSHSLNSHTHSESAHTHSLNSHTHSESAHTHSLNSHTHSIATHNHTGPSHTHTYTVLSHQHAIGNHTHGITYGIYETSPAVTWHYHIDNGAGYGVASSTYNSDQRDLDITSLVTTSGIKSVKIDVDDLCTVEVDVKIKLEITA